MQVFFVLAIFGLWLLGISVGIFRIYRLFNRLAKGVKEEDLKKVLEKILAQEAKNEKEISEIRKKISFIEEEGKFHVQKIGLVRFNPFKELGGEHSFSLAILDGNDSGVIITGLHSRDRTRIYVKSIKKGKCNLELSEEEKKALGIAQKK